jgi:G:T-mismatch repair DNA endonuclease (very short patch repair protein)
VERDQRKARELGRLGWRVLTIWECELNERRLRQLLRAVHQRS